MTPFFKPILGFIALLLLGCLVMVGTGHAQSVIQLKQPFEISQRPACSGSSFNADSSILGACRTLAFTACSGRGCQPVTYTTTYVVHWDSGGNPGGVEACSLLRHHLPQADVLSYLGGHSAADCPNLLTQTGTVVVLDGVPYYYITTDPVSGTELVVGY